MKTIQKGFTLIELMIVIAIIGVLAIVALPKYSDLPGRAQVSEAVSLAEGQKVAVMEYYAYKGAWPTSNAEAGIADKDDITGNYVASVEISSKGDGKITATMKKEGVNKDIVEETVSLTPQVKDGSIIWSCSSSLDKDLKNLLPPSCR